MNFVKRHSLMDWAVQSSRKEGPLFIKTSMEERLTVVGVDAGVKAVDGASYDVIFVGTTSGRILKLAYPKSGDANAILVESIQVRNINQLMRIFPPIAIINLVSWSLFLFENTSSLASLIRTSFASPLKS